MIHSVTTIHLGLEIVTAAFKTALHQNKLGRGNFFHDIRKALIREITSSLSSLGIITDYPLNYDDDYYGRTKHYASNVLPLNPIIKYTGWNNEFKQMLDVGFCRGYGYGEYSLNAINYIDRGYCELPSLMPFRTIEQFSIGNIILQIDSGGHHIRLEFETGVHAVGYACNTTRNKKSFISVFGIWFSKNLIETIVDKLGIDFSLNLSNLDECHIGVMRFPIIFIDRVTGKLYTCTCFSKNLNIEDDLVRCLPYGGSEQILLDAVRSIEFLDGICHLCTGGVPKLKYGSSMYYSSFLQSYNPYHELLVRKKLLYQAPNDVDGRQLENELRQLFGYPKIGEKWITETILLKIVQMLFEGIPVIHHYRGTELQGLEIDIWVPKLKIAIEYQGEQHYQVIKHWGGEEGLKQRIANDKKKKRLCKQMGYQLIEFRYDENITEELVLKKLRRFKKEST